MSWIWDSKFVFFVVNGLIKGDIEKSSGQFICFSVMSHWHVEFWIWIRDIFVVLYFYLYLCGESRLLVSWCVSSRCGMAGSDKDLGRSRRPGEEEQRWSNTGRILGGSSLMIWSSKSLRRFLDLSFKTRQSLICRLCHKIDGGRMMWDTRQDLVACFTWKKVMLGFSSVVLRLVEARQWVVHVTSSRRLRWVEAEDGWVDATGCVKPFYHKIVISSVLGPKGIIVF
jgi:hypothetical protein